MTATVLIVDDDVAMLHMLATSLGRHGFVVESAPDAKTAFRVARERDLDVIVTDLRMPDEDGVSLCGRLVADRADVPVLVMTSFGSVDSAIGAIRAGAYDFVPKPFEIPVMVAAIERAVEHRRLREEVRRLRRAVTSAETADLVGESPAMTGLRAAISRLARSTSTVLITGESGTGKELVAHALHDQSPRANHPFVAVNCAAIPEVLLESELFGHVRGAFTDARSNHVGLFAQATHGTLFLDEVGELPLVLQPKLLRALEERTIRPVGSDREIAIDVRIVAATNRDLTALAREGRFREDLLFRLDVLRIEIPPLRERGRDVLALANHFLRRDGQAREISSATARRLLAYRWPGNVRELRNVIEHAVAIAHYDVLSPEDLPERVLADVPVRGAAVFEDDDLPTMAEMERRYIVRVLDAVGGNKSAAARILGFDRATLYRRLERTTHDRPPDGPPDGPPDDGASGG